MIAKLESFISVRFQGNKRLFAVAVLGCLDLGAWAVFAILGSWPMWVCLALLIPLFWYTAQHCPRPKAKEEAPEVRP